MSDPSYNSRISHWIDVSKQLVPFNDDRKSLSIKAGEIRATNLSGKQWGQDISNFLKLAGDDNTYINLVQGGGLEISSNDLKYSKSKLDASNIDSHYLTANDVNFTKLKVQDLSASSVDISTNLRVITGTNEVLNISNTGSDNSTIVMRNSNLTIGGNEGNTQSFKSYNGLELQGKERYTNGNADDPDNTLKMTTKGNNTTSRDLFEITKIKDEHPKIVIYDRPTAGGAQGDEFFSIIKNTKGLLSLKGDISATHDINAGLNINAQTGRVTSANLTVNSKIQTGTNNVTIQVPLLAENNVNISGDLIVDGSGTGINPSLTLVQDKLDLFVDTSFNLNVDISNHLLVKDVSVNNTVSIVNDLNVNDKLTVNSNFIQVDKQLNVNKGANFNFNSSSKYDFSINLANDNSEFILNKALNNGKINLIENKLSLNHDLKIDISSNAIKLIGGLEVIDNKSLNNIYLDISNGNVEFKNNNNFKINNGSTSFLDVSTNSTTLNTDTLNLQSGTGSNDTIKFSLEKGDISNNGYIHNYGDVSLVGSRFTITQTDVSMSQNVFMGQDLSVSNTVDICNTLNVLNGLTRLLDLSASTVEISGGLIYNTTIGLTNPADASFTFVTVSNDLFVLGRSYFNSDVSINGGSLTVDNDISGGATLHIGGRADFNSDVSINSSLTVTNNIHAERILITSTVTDISTSANIQGDISAGGKLDIYNGATIGGDLRVKGPNLYLSNANTNNTFDSSYSYIYGGNTIIIDPLAVGDTSGTVIIEGDFTVKGTTTTINSTNLDVSDVNIKLASNYVGTAAALGTSTLRPGIDISDIVTLSVITATGATGKEIIEDIKWKSNLGIYTESDISALSGTIDTNLNVGSLLSSNTLNVGNGNLVVDSTNGVTTNLSLSVNGDISTNSYLYVNDYIHNYGDVSLVNSRFTITQTDVSMSQNVFMGQDLSVNGNVDIYGTLDVNTLQVSRLDNLEFVGINRTGTDFSFNIGTDFSVDKSGNTIIGGNVDISNGLDLSGNFTQQKGTITFTGTTDKSLYIDTSANLDLSGTININNNNIQLTSDGSGYFVGDLSVGGYLEIAKTTDLCNTLNVLNGLTRLLDLSASTVEISGGSINNTTIGLTKPVDASFAYVTVSNDLVVSGRSDFNSDVSINNASLTVDNDITFANSDQKTVTSRHLGVDSLGQVTTSKLLIKDDKSKTSPDNIANFDESLITLSQNVTLSDGKKITLQTSGASQTTAPIEIMDDTGNIIIKLHPNSGNYSEFKNDISLIGNVDLGTSENSDIINIGKGPFTKDNLHVRATSTFYHNMILDTDGGTSDAYLLVGNNSADNSNTFINKESISLRQGTTNKISLNNDGTATFEGDITVLNNANINLQNANSIQLAGSKSIDSTGAANLTNISGSSLYLSGYLNVDGDVVFTSSSTLDVNSKSLSIMEKGDIEFESNKNFKIYSGTSTQNTTILDVSTNSTTLNTDTLNLQSGSGSNDTIKFSLQTGDISNNGYIHNYGDVSLVNSRFTITQTDVSMSQNVFMGQDLSVNGNVDIYGTLDVNTLQVSRLDNLEFVGINRTGTDFSFNIGTDFSVDKSGNTIIGGNVDISNGLDLSGNFTQQNGTITFTGTTDKSLYIDSSANLDLSGTININNNNIQLTSDGSGYFVGDLSANGNLDIYGATNLFSTLNVLNGLTRLLDLSASTVEISGGSINNTTIGLTNPDDASFAYVTVSNDLVVSGRSDFNSDVSINGGSLTVDNDISGGATLHIGGRADFNSDVSINSSLTVTNNIHAERILITSTVTDISTSANIQGDISAGGKLDISNGATIGGDLRVKGPNLYLSNATSSDTFDFSRSYIYGANTIIIDPLAVGDTSGTVIIEGDFTVKGTTTTINSTNLDVSDVNIKLASNYVGTVAAIGSTTLQPGIDISDIVTLSVINATGSTGKNAIEAIKWKSNLGIYTESDISALSGTIDTTLNVGTQLTSNTLQVNTNNLVVNSTNVSTNLPLSVTGDISTNSYLYVQDYIHNIGDVSLVNNNFTITPSEVSMNPNVFMGQDLSVNGNVDICNTLTVLNARTTLSDLSALTVQIFDGSINGTEIGLTVAADASFNYVTISDELYVGSHIKTLDNSAIITNTYSAFKVANSFVKQDKFVHSSSLDNSGDKWYDLSDSGFLLDYRNSPLLSSKSFVKIDVKLNFVASNEAEQFISFRLMKGSTEVKHDLSLGSVFGIGSRGIYQSSFIDYPDMSNPVYSLQFWVDRGVDETIDISSGVIIDPLSTYFYAQELYQPE